MSTKNCIIAGMVGIVLPIIAPAALAVAQTDLWFGGNTDCTSEMYMNAGSNPVEGHNNIPVVFGTCDGDFAPFVGSTRPDDAIAQGVAAGRAIWDDNCANGVEECTLHGFSIGAAPATIVANDVGADKPGSNTHLITEGNAWGQLGVFGGKPGIVGIGINIAAPFIGAPTQLPQAAGSENRFNVNDGFADNATQPPWAEVTQLSCLNGCGGLPAQHFIQTGEPTATFTTDDGVTQKVYGDPLPGVVPPQNNPALNPELLSAPEPVAPVLADPMEAFGQQMAGVPPCVAPDGGEYRTPAGVGC